MKNERKREREKERKREKERERESVCVKKVGKKEPTGTDGHARTYRSGVGVGKGGWVGERVLQDAVQETTEGWQRTCTHALTSMRAPQRCRHIAANQAKVLRVSVGSFMDHLGLVRACLPCDLQKARNQWTEALCGTAAYCLVCWHLRRAHTPCLVPRVHARVHVLHLHRGSCTCTGTGTCTCTGSCTGTCTGTCTGAWWRALQVLETMDQFDPQGSESESA